jgi:hypothetical protein
LSSWLKTIIEKFSWAVPRLPGGAERHELDCADEAAGRSHDLFVRQDLVHAVSIKPVLIFLPLFESA